MTLAQEKIKYTCNVVESNPVKIVLIILWIWIIKSCATKSCALFLFSRLMIDMHWVSHMSEKNLKSHKLQQISRFSCCMKQYGDALLHLMQRWLIYVDSNCHKDKYTYFNGLKFWGTSLLIKMNAMTVYFCTNL